MSVAGTFDFIYYDYTCETPKQSLRGNELVRGESSRDPQSEVSKRGDHEAAKTTMSATVTPFKDYARGLRECLRDTALGTGRGVAQGIEDTAKDPGGAKSSGRRGVHQT